MINLVVDITAKAVPSNPDDVQVAETTTDGTISPYLIDENSDALVNFNAFASIIGER